MYNIVEIGGVVNNHFRRNIFVSLNQVNEKRFIFNNTDVYATIWFYNNSKNFQDSTAPLYFDIDVSLFDNIELNVMRSQQEALSLCNALSSEFFIPKEFIRIRFSGNKGFHILVSQDIFNTSPDHELFYWKSIGKYFGKYYNIDTSIYERRRLFRFTNSINSKSGLYKIPLTYNELKNKSAKEILDLAKKEREIEEEPVFFIKQAKESLLNFIENISEKEIKKFKKPPCIESLEKGVGSGERNVGAFTLAIYYKNTGLKKEDVTQKLWYWNEKNTPKEENFEEIEKTIDQVFKNEYNIGCSTSELEKHCNKKNCPIYKKE